MMTTKNPKALAVTTTALCIASIFWLMSTQRVNRSLETDLGHEKLRSESLLSEKLLLEKDIEKIKVQFSALKGINSELDNAVKEAESRFIQQESELRNLKRQNASLAQIKKQREELQRIKAALESQLASLHSSNADLERQNMMLNNTISQLQDQNRLLTNDLNRAMFAAVDHSQVQAVKGRKEKLTIRARQTQKLITDFEVSASLRNLSYRILDPQGNLLSQRQGEIISQIHASDGNILASAGEGPTGNNLQKVRVEYIPKRKMISGVYTVEILNDNLYVGSMNVKLR